MLSDLLASSLDGCWVILHMHADAQRCGNKTKFFNHQESGNLRTRYTVVNGEFRVGFYALRNMDIGREMCFDYGYKEEHMDAVAVRSSRPSHGHKSN